MPRLSWNEIQHRAVDFAARWAGETCGKGESQTFWSEFLIVYGIDRRRHGAFFEYAIKKTGNTQGFIDLFRPGKLLAVHKSGEIGPIVARQQELCTAIGARVGDLERTA